MNRWMVFLLVTSISLTLGGKGHENARRLEVSSVRERERAVDREVRALRRSTKQRLDRSAREVSELRRDTDAGLGSHWCGFSDGHPRTDVLNYSTRLEHERRLTSISLTTTQIAQGKEGRDDGHQVRIGLDDEHVRVLAGSSLELLGASRPRGGAVRQVGPLGTVLLHLSSGRMPDVRQTVTSTNYSARGKDSQIVERETGLTEDRGALLEPALSTPCSRRSWISRTMGPIEHDKRLAALIRCVVARWWPGHVQIVSDIIERESGGNNFAKNPDTAGACRVETENLYGSCGLLQNLARYWVARAALISVAIGSRCGLPRGGTLVAQSLLGSE